MKFLDIKHIVSAAALAIVAFGFTACTKDLDVENINPQQVPDVNEDALFTKIYANMVTTGQTGPNGNGDIDDIDEGTSSLIRQLWNANELTTDESHCIWGDAGIPEFNHNSWSDTHPMMQALYYRLYFGITVANYFLQQTEGATDDKVLTQRAEARFLRAFYYSFIVDLYGGGPFVTTVSSEAAPYASRTELFNYVEKELLSIIGEGDGNEILKDPAQRVAYGRADKAAAWLLLSRMYLNAEVYTGTAQWAKAQSYAEKVLADGTYDILTSTSYSYTPFQLLFMGDNDSNGAQKEIILPAIHDGISTQTWGGCLFVIASTCSEAINKAYYYGTSENWGGNHCRKQFVEKFFPSGGYATGTYVGGKLANALVGGQVTMEVVTSSRNPDALAYLRSFGYGLTVLNVEAGRDGVPKYLILSTIDKKQVHIFRENINRVDPKAMIMIQSTLSRVGGYDRAKILSAEDYHKAYQMYLSRRKKSVFGLQKYLVAEFEKQFKITKTDTFKLMAAMRDDRLAEEKSKRAAQLTAKAVQNKEK